MTGLPEVREYIPPMRRVSTPGVNAAMAYLRSARSAKSKATATSILNTVAYLLGETGHEQLDWSTLTAERVNLILIFIRGTREEHDAYPSVVRVRDRYFDYMKEHKAGPQKDRYRDSASPATCYWKPFAQSTCNLYLSILKGVAKHGFLLDQIKEKEYLRIRDISGFKTSGHDRGPLKLTPQKVIDTIDECIALGTKAGIRDAAILSLLYGAGLRRSELRSLRPENIDWDTDQIAFLGKGKKKRRVPLLPKVKACVKAWCEIRVQENDTPGALFVGISRHDKLLFRADANGDIKPMGHNVTYELIQRKFCLSKVGPKFGPHELRAVFGTALLDEDVSINTVADLMGHANINTTRIYDRAKEERKKKGIMKLPT